MAPQLLSREQPLGWNCPMTPHSPKRRRLFDKVKEYKNRFRLESSDALRKRVTTRSRYKEG
jgi:hypothetical protein